MFHFAGFRVVRPERVHLLVELRREELDLLDQDLDPVRGDGVRDQLPDLLAAAREVEPAVPVARARCPADLPQPAEVGLVGQGARVRQQHVHGLAEAAEGEIELGADVLGFEDPHTGVEIVLVRDRLEEPHRGRVAALEPREFVHVRGERSLDVGRREHRERLGQLHGDAPSSPRRGRRSSRRRRGGSRGRWPGVASAPGAARRDT